MAELACTAVLTISYALMRTCSPWSAPKSLVGPDIVLERVVDDLDELVAGCIAEVGEPKRGAIGGVVEDADEAVGESALGRREIGRPERESARDDALERLEQGDGRVVVLTRGRHGCFGEQAAAWARLGSDRGQIL